MDTSVNTAFGKEAFKDTDAAGNLPDAFADFEAESELAVDPGFQAGPIADILGGVVPPVANDAAGDTTEEEKYPQALLDAAGIDAERAEKQFGTLNALASAVTMMDRRAMEAAQNLPAPMEEYGDEEGVVANEPVVTPPAEDNMDWFPDPTDGSEWDPDTKKAFKVADAKHRAEMAALTAELNEQREFLISMAADQEASIEQQQQQSSNEYVQYFDTFIDSLGETYAPVFGEGSGFNLDQNSMAYQNRLALDQSANVLAAGREALGQPALPREELLVRAMRVSFPEVHEQTVETKVAARQKQYTARPTQRASVGDLPPGEAKAIAGLREWFKDHDTPMVQEIDDGLDGDI